MSDSLPPIVKRNRSSSSPLIYLESNGPPSFHASELPELQRVNSRSSQVGTAPITFRGGNPLVTGSSNLSRIPTSTQLLSRSKSRRIEEESVHENEAEVNRLGSPIVGNDLEEGTAEEDEEDLEIYNKFTSRKKNYIVAIVAYCALLAPFSSSSFLPSIPEISKDLNTTATILNISVAAFIVVIGISPLMWAPYAGVYGRKAVYMVSLPIFTLSSLGVALSPNLVSLFVMRCFQGVGSSAVLSVGAGSIGDLYPRSRRGGAMGWFYSGILVGPAMAPAIAGVLTEYAKPSGWRAMQYLLFAMGGVGTLLVFFLLPETIHHKGADSIREERRLIREAKGEVELEKDREKLGMFGKWWEKRTRNYVIKVLNPLAPLRMLLHPHIVTVSLNSSFVLMSVYTVLVPLSSTLAPRYNITNSAILGCIYLASGIGNILAGRFTGKYSDVVLAKWLKRRNGVYVPEDRLRATLLGGGLVLPISVLALGWVLDKAEGKVGLAFSILLLVCNGIGLMMILTPANTYCVDVFQTRSAEVIAVNNSLRYLLSAAASAFVLPLIEKIGVGLTNTFSAILCWIGFLLILITIRYGPKMRELGAKWENFEEEEFPLQHKVKEEVEEAKVVNASESTLVVKETKGGRKEES